MIDPSDAALDALPSPSSGLASDTSQDQQIIGRIVYLASLMSESTAIDTEMDTLRMITAHMKPGEPLNEQDRAALSQLEAKIKLYLINEDPLRAFTSESLEARLQERTLAKNRQRGDLKAFATVLLLSVSAGFTGIAFTPGSDPALRPLLAVPLFFLVLHIGAAWFYLSALQQFKEELRRAFRLISVATVLFAVVFSHYVVIQFFQLWQYPVFKYAGLLWLASICLTSIYLGVREFARALQMRTHFASLRWAGLTALAVTLLLVLLPHHGHVPEEPFFDLSVASAGVIIVAASFSTGAIRQILKQVTPAYAKPMRLLYLYALLNLIGSVAGTAALFWLGEVKGETLSILIAICTTPTQLLLLYTGYSFKKETSH